MKQERQVNAVIIFWIRLSLMYVLLWGDGWVVNKIIWSNSIDGAYTDPLWIRRHLFNYHLILIGFLPFWIMYSIRRWYTTWVIGNLIGIWVFAPNIIQYADRNHYWIAIYSAMALLLVLAIAAWDLWHKAVGKSGAHFKQ